MENTTATSAPGGYRGQEHLTDTEDAAGVEHHRVKLGRRYERGCRNLGESAPRVNGTFSSACKQDNQHRLQLGQNMSGGD